MSVLKAIPTQYNGYSFRSRLEARWAVFYDNLGVPYQYEPEGYDLDGLRYLPDFWLRQQGCWIEIKAGRPSKVEYEKAYRLAAATGKAVYVFYGDCWYPDPNDLLPPAWAEPNGPAEAIYPDGWDSSYCWCECPKPGCGKVGIQFEGYGDRICNHEDFRKICTYASSKIVAAFRASRAYRFY